LWLPLCFLPACGRASGLRLWSIQANFSVERMAGPAWFLPIRELRRRQPLLTLALGANVVILLRAVIFDFFGTLVPNFTQSAHKDMLRQMACITGAPIERFVEGWLATFNQRATGIFPTTRSNIEAVCRGLDVAPEDYQYEAAIRLRCEFEKAQAVPRPAAISTLQAVRSLGLKTCLISDCSAELPQIWHETPFAPFFDSAVFSCCVKMRKPNREIYFEACRQLEVEPAQCLYVGDGGSRELSGASQAGMSAILLASPEEQDNADTHRIDAEVWTGRKISELEELLAILEQSTSEPTARRFADNSP
jgi:putative hydrolase of the HAD superfamily